MRITDFSVDRPVSITMIVLIIVVIGLLSLSRIGLDMMPDVDFPTVSVVTRYEGAASEDVEKLVTRTIEGAAATVSGVTSVKSFSQEDVSFVLVEFDWGTNLDAAAADLRESLGLVAPMLPEDSEAPMVLKFSLSAMPVLSYGVRGMDGNSIALGKYLDDTLKPRLERLPGVASVVAMGGLEREVQVHINRTSLESAGLSLQQVTQALFAQNLTLPAGRVVEGSSEYLLRTLGEFESLQAIENAVVGAAFDGTPVRVRDVARVELGTQDVRNEIRTNGERAAYLMVQKQSGANPLDVTRRVKKELGEIGKELPGDIRFDLVMDLGSQIQNMSTNVTRTGLIGGLLAVLFMFLFLRSMRPTLAIAVAIPLSLLVTFIPIYITGETLNLMTMGGLMLGIGMLVDNAVVVIENIFRHLEQGKDRKEAARDGAREIAMAITASTLTTMAVFLPLFFGGGIAGELVRGLAMVVAFALGASLLVALTIVPMLASVFFSRSEAIAASREGGPFTLFRARYVRALRWVLAHRLVTLGVAFALFIGSIAAAPLAGMEFMPGTDQPVVLGLAKFPVGTPYEVTSRAVDRVETYARTLPEAETVGATIGVNEDDLGAALSEMSPTGVHEAQIFIRLRADRDNNQQDTLKTLRENAPKIEGMSLEFFDMGQMLFGGSGSKPVQIQVRGAELPVLERIANQIATSIKTVDGVSDVTTSVDQAKPERHLVVDREKAASYGLTVGEIAQAVESATQGAIAGQYRDRGEEYFIRVRYAPEDRESLDDLDRITVMTRAGFQVPLRQVAQFQPGTGPVKIARTDQAREVKITAAITGRDIGSVFSDIDVALGPVRDNLALGYTIDYGGTYEMMVDSFIKLVGALLLAILLVYMVMASQFEAFVQPLVIMVTLPLAVVGVSAVLVLTGTPFSVVTFVGVIMLAGIVVNNGIVLVDYINQLRRDGMERREAIVQAGSTRLRAVLITSGTTITGLLPMALIPGRGAELTADMALTVAGGLAASAFLTLLVLPVVYEIFDTVGERVGGLLSRLVNGSDEALMPEPTPELASSEAGAW